MWVGNYCFVYFVWKNKISSIYLVIRMIGKGFLRCLIGMTVGEGPDNFAGDW